MVGPWDAGIEAGYTRYSFYYDPFDGDVGPPNIAPDGEFLDSFDVSLSARWHPNLRTIHPYVNIGAGVHTVHGYFPEAEPLKLTRQIKPGAHAGVGLHGIVVPALGVEARWLMISDGGGRERHVLYPRDHNVNLIHILFSLTVE